MRPHAAPLLAATDLAVARGGLLLLERVGLALGPGESIALRGPNGIGKTSLLRTLAGLQPPAAGRVEAQADAVAYAAHADGLKPTLTAGENLAFWAAIFRGGEPAQALAAFGLSHLAGRFAKDLSAGQKRRLGLARLLVTGRPVWALDEPTVSLDAAAVRLFAEALRRHLGEGGAAIVATHADLGLPLRELPLEPYRAATPARGAFDEAFG